MERRYIQTVARRGYRFIADVCEVAATPHGSRPVAEALPPETKQESATVVGLTSAVEAKRPARNWLLAAVFGVLIATLLGGGWMLLKPRAPIRTLAVLPFTVEGPTSTGAPDEVLLLGMTDELVSRLEGELVVRPTSSVLRYTGAKAVDAVAAGREQGVDAVLTGTLESSLGRTRLRLRLYRVRDGVVLWQDSFSGGANGLAEIQQKAGEAATRELQRFKRFRRAASQAAANKPAATKVHADDQRHWALSAGASTSEIRRHRSGGCARAPNTSGSRSTRIRTMRPRMPGWPTRMRCWRRSRSSRDGRRMRMRGRRRSLRFRSIPRWPNPTRRWG